MSVKGTICIHGPIKIGNNGLLNRVIAHIAQASRVGRMHFVFRHENNSGTVTIPSGATAKLLFLHFCIIFAHKEYG